MAEAVAKHMNYPRILIPHGHDRAACRAILSLGRAGYPIVVALSPLNRQLTVLHSRYVFKFIECPDPLRHQCEFRIWLASYLTEHPSDLVLPIHEGVVHAAALLRGLEFLHECFVLPHDEHLKYSLSKVAATKAAKTAGIAIPRTVVLREPGRTCYSIDEDKLSFPCLLKWDNCEDDEGRYQKGSNCRVANREALGVLLVELEPLTGGVMVQELVPGHGVGAFFLLHKGEILLRFAHRRLHEVPWTGGVSSLCESSDDRELLGAGERLLESIDYEGVAMVEFRKEEGKSPVFLEIKGRLWGSLGLATAAGVDFPLAMVECHLHGATKVRQPDLSSRERWREPKLELDYLHSLWTKEAGPCDGPAPRLRGALSVLWNLIDPCTFSDWSWRDGYWRTARRHLGLMRREAAVLKQMAIKHWRSRKPDPMIDNALIRTRKLLERAGDSSPESLIFQCYGNICRSPYAEFRWQQWREGNSSLPPAISAGFHENVERLTPARFQSAARHRGVELGGHRSKLLTQAMVDEAAWIVLMDERNLKDFQKMFPGLMDKVVLLGACDDPSDPIIPDPYGEAIGAGVKAYHRIDTALAALCSALTVGGKES